MRSSRSLRDVFAVDIHSFKSLSARSCFFDATSRSYSNPFSVWFLTRHSECVSHSFWETPLVDLFSVFSMLFPNSIKFPSSTSSLALILSKRFTL